MISDVSVSTARDRRLRALLQERLDGAASRAATIPKRPQGEPAPLAPMQESIWLLQRMSPESTANHRPTAFRLSGPLDSSALQAALDDLVARHESLRSTVHLIDGQPRQVVVPPSPVNLVRLDVSGAADPEAAAFELAKAAALEPFDLENGPILRARLVHLFTDDHLLVLQLHHVSMDGWSEGALQADLSAAYSARLRGEAPDLKPLRVQVGDIAAWQQLASQTGAHESSLAYWRRQLEGLPTTLDLPTDRPRAGASLVSDTVTFEIPPDVANRARELARAEGTTLYSVLLAAFEVLLFRTARQSDFAIGMPVAGRTHAEMEGVVGCLINLLVLRARVDGEMPFQAHLHHVRTTVLEALQHQAVPLADVVSGAFPGRQSFEPVYSTLVQLRNFPGMASEASLYMEPVHVPVGEADLDLSLDVVDRGATRALACRMAYRSDLFDAATVQRMARHFLTLLDAAATDPTKSIGRLPLLTGEERNHVLEAFQSPRLAPLALGGIQVLVEQQAARQPDARALVFDDEIWTYDDLNTRANRLAWRLRALGVGPGVAVALGFGPSPELHMAVLAILKAGGAYVPLDSAYPEARVQAILTGVGAPILIVHGSFPWPDLDANAFGLLVLDLEPLDLCAEPDTNPPTDGLPPDRPAYVLYTSGSTGEPKGVMITQANLLAAAPGWEAVYRLGERKVSLQMARPTFDVFTEEWITSLGYGLALVDCPLDTLLDPPRLVQLLRDQKVEIISTVPAVCRLLTTYLEETGQQLETLHLALVGADVWHPDDHARLQTVLPNAEIQNGYGITEVTVSNSYFIGTSPSLPSGSVPIGRPYPNSLLYVLDAHLEPVPVGVAGELYIGGPVVGAGYVGRPDLTAERFLPDPFADKPGAQMYRSGDLVRWLPSGDLDFLGRIDFQVKVRGLRIELGEIEAVLAAHPSVAQATVTVQRGERDDDSLVAHVIPAVGTDLDLDVLRAHARRQLADYMVPSALAVLDQFPLSANGKVDRRALEARTVVQEERPAGEPPRTPEEIGLAEIWADVLGVDAVCQTDNFFDLGGHSLRAMQVIARVQQRWGVSLAFRDLVEAPGLADLADRIHVGEAPNELADQGTHILRMAGTGVGTPILLVHGVEANSLQFIKLARLLADHHVVYGTQGQGLDGGEISHRSVEEIAAAYAEEWVALGIDGPVTLVGLCYGSMLALELARQLEARGADVEALLSINQTELPHTIRQRKRAASKTLRGRLRSAQSVAGAWVRRGIWRLHQRTEATGRSLGAFGQIGYVQQALAYEAWKADLARIDRVGRTYEGAAGDPEPLSEEIRDAVEQYIQKRVQETYIALIEAYRGAPFAGRFVYLLSDTHREEPFGERLAQLVGDAEIRDIPGPHAPIEDPHVCNLAAEISAVSTPARISRSSSRPARSGCPTRSARTRWRQ